GRAHGDRLAAFRRAVRALLRGQPRDPAERSEHALAAALDATLRPRALPVLHGARGHRRQAEGPHRDPGRQLDHARSGGHPVGTVAMGRIVAAVCAAALLVGASACGERSEPTGANADLYPVTITTGDRPITISEPARRIAVLDPTAGQIVRALGAG